MKLQKKYLKKGYLVKLFDLTKIDLNEHIKGLKKEDVVVFIGGDGTIHNIINEASLKDIPCKVYYYRAGSGNDFARGHKGKCFDVTEEMKSLPCFYANDKPEYFVNGVGMGIDALVCDLVNKNNKKESYFKTAVKAFKEFKPFHLVINCDGIDYTFDNVWFFVVNNGKYMGGGMKIAPNAIRLDDYLDLVVVHNLKRSKLLRIFPLIFIGKHIWFKKAVFQKRVKEVKIKEITYHTLQSDGEVLNDVTNLKILRKD